MRENQTISQFRKMLNYVGRKNGLTKGEMWRVQQSVKSSEFHANKHQDTSLGSLAVRYFQEWRGK